MLSLAQSLFESKRTYVGYLALCVFYLHGNECNDALHVAENCHTCVINPTTSVCVSLWQQSIQDESD
jgi:hypothetical protein